MPEENLEIIAAQNKNSQNRPGIDTFVRIDLPKRNKMMLTLKFKNPYRNMTERMRPKTELEKNLSERLYTGNALTGALVMFYFAGLLTDKWTQLSNLKIIGHFMFILLGLFMIAGAMYRLYIYKLFGYRPFVEEQD